MDIPVYLTHTSLVNDLKAIGRVPFRYLLIQMPCGTQVGTLADPSVDLS